MKSLAEELRLRPRMLLDRTDAEPSMFIYDISKIFSKMVHQDFGEEGLSHGYRKIFKILCLRDGITQVELAKAAGLSSPSVSAALNKMEQDGLVERRPDNRDRRKVFVYITEEGRNKDNMIMERCHELEKVMTRGFTDKERTQLIELLRKALKNMIEEEQL